MDRQIESRQSPVRGDGCIFEGANKEEAKEKHITSTSRIMCLHLRCLQFVRTVDPVTLMETLRSCLCVSICVCVYPWHAILKPIECH